MDCVVLDLETTHLSAIGAGFTLCAVARPTHGESKVWRYDDWHCRPGHEQRMLRDLIDYLDGFDLWIGHNLERFDFNFLKSRAYQLGLGFPCSPLTYDTLLAFKRVGYLTERNYKGHPKASLGHVADFLGLKQEKTSIFPREHWQTVWGLGEERKLAMDNLVEHCVADVNMTEQVYWKLLKADPVWGIRRKK